MSENSKIEWTDHTWTPVVGCDAVSPACANCYAALMAARLDAMGMEKYRGVAVRVGGKGKWTGQVNFSKADLVKPLTVRKKRGSPRANSNGTRSTGPAIPVANTCPISPVCRMRSKTGNISLMRHPARSLPEFDKGVAG